MDDLISEFITETSESISVLDLELVKLEQNPEDMAILGNIFRLMHTIKGTCGFLGLPRLEKVAHASENVLGKIRDKSLQVTPQAISIVLESLDMIKNIIEYLGIKGEEPVGNDSDLIARLNACAEGDNAPVAVTTESAPEPAQEIIPMVEEKPHAVAAVVAPKKEAPSMEVAQQPGMDAAINQGLTVEAKEGANLANQSIRVSLEVLENLMQMVGELVLTRNQLMQLVRTRNDNDFLAPLQHLSHITTELQDGVMKTRMQPIGNAWSKFPRLVRDLSIDLGKKIELRMIGAETELDRQLLEMIKDPLTHMVRNSCDHGLETLSERIAAGKSEVGTVTLSAYHEGGHIRIEISDDGRGINVEKVKQKIIKNGLASSAELENMSESQIAQFIFRAGFSTAEAITSVSGRGVGMDVVRSNIEKIGGTVELSSSFGKGSNFLIKIPLTLAIVSVLIVESSGFKFAIPQINVTELVRASAGSDHRIEKINDASVMRLRGKLLPLISLSQVLNCEEEALNPEHDFIVVCKVGGYDFGLLVDRIYDTEEIVVKPVTSLLQNIPVYAGNTILGDGSVIMVLDPNGLGRASGNAEGSGQSDVSSSKTNASAQHYESFLIFKAGRGAPKAVPLELVSRLEEIDTSLMEWSGEYPVIQYRGDLMRLVLLNTGYEMPRSGMHPVIVFVYDNKTLGLVVEEINDIVEVALDLKLSSKEEGYVGSMVIENKTTDIVDVGFLLSDLISDSMDTAHNPGAIKAQNMTLLLVDDSPFFRNITVPLLTSIGYNVVVAESANQALQLLEKMPHCHLIITDIEMPEIDGIEFAQMCRTQGGRLSQIPIIAFSTTINQTVINRGATAGISDFIVKTDREGLLNAISKHLSLEKEELA